ncbi:caspase recruitment domain-containing protein 8-like [Mixophyes fleayi]|uniref:caspase recruitment domain-containing protein 8-like n=1 Tax=Mixophyes fleayi TaxID=3061075 RepID=UPI003F4DCD9F
MGRTVRDALAAALYNLGKKGLKKFINKLNDWEIKDGYNKIPRGQLEDTDPEDIADLIRKYYTDSYGIEVTLAVLDAIDEKKVAEDLRADLGNVDDFTLQVEPKGSDQKAASKVNYPPIHEPRKHFVIEQRETLINRISLVRPVLDELLGKNLLTYEQYDTIRSKPTPREQMRELYHYVRSWGDTDMDVVYKSLTKYNFPLIQNLESVEKVFDFEKISEYTSTSVSFTGEEHFVDKHRLHIISNVSLVDPVLDDLLEQKLLPEILYETVRNKITSQEKMRELYYYVTSWGNDEKDQLLQVLRKHNKSLITNLESKKNKKPCPLPLQHSETWDEQWTMKPSSSGVNAPPKDEGIQIISAHTSCDQPQRRQMECKLCGKDQDSGDVVIPVMNGSTYRLEMTSAGLFRCQKTGIKFQVTHPVTIEYNLESWDNHLKGIQGNKYEIVGPLFNIKTDVEPHVVSAVYLPHYLCIESFTGDKTQIKCAHFKDGNLTLETPSRIDPFYIVLENPTFSFLGALLSFWNLSVPIHGIVLLYFSTVCKGDPKYQEYKIHLYLLPYSADAEKMLDEKKSKFQRIDKPLHTNNTVYTKIKYLVRGDPDVSVIPQSLQFQSEPYQCTEISITGDDINIYLEVSEVDSEAVIWKAHLTKGELRQWSGQMVEPNQQKEPFVDKHREYLIRDISLVEPVLDGLKTEKLLTSEQYDTVCSKSTSQEKMRALYAFVKSWGDDGKKSFYRILQDTNGPIIRKLERVDSQS